MSDRSDSKDDYRTLIAVESGGRLDKVLAAAYPDLSRSQCQRLINDGYVTVDGAVSKASQRLTAGERVSIVVPPSSEAELVPEPIPLDIRYDDDDIVIVNKAAGMVVHPSAGHESGTLVNALLALYPDLPGVGGEKRPGIVHRLDKDTSGLIAAAKNDAALRYLQKQFKSREVQKTYLALVEGNISQRELRIEASIGRDPKDRKKMAVIAQGGSAKSREAVTLVLPKSRYHDHELYGYTLVECHPVTGRTHQIRVHLAYAGFPIVGDRVYGRRKQRIDVRRHFLHAAQLTIKKPSDGEALTIKAPLPRELERVLEELTKV
jgi:23S rRNA pseudouridine1911/1915/1917 synthase